MHFFGAISNFSLFKFNGPRKSVGNVQQLTNPIISMVGDLGGGVAVIVPQCNNNYHTEIHFLPIKHFE